MWEGQLAGKQNGHCSLLTGPAAALGMHATQGTHVVVLPLTEELLSGRI